MSLGISVVIPLCNHSQCISDAIESVLNQKYDPSEIIVVDDGSTDNSLDRLEKFGDEVVIVKQKNSGPSAARNRGVREATYDTVVFLDADDRFRPGCLEAHARVREFWSDIKLSIVSYQEVSEISENSFDLTNRFEGCDDKEGIVRYEQFSSDFVLNLPSGTICIDKEYFEEIGGYDPQLRCWEISDFMLRVLLGLEAYAVAKAPLVSIYRNVEGGQFNNTNKDPGYLLRYSKKIVDRMGHMARRDRFRFSKFVKTALNNLYDNKDFQEFKELARYSRGKVEVVDNGHRKLRVISAIPTRVLEWISGVR